MYRLFLTLLRHGSTLDTHTMPIDNLNDYLEAGKNIFSIPSRSVLIAGFELFVFSERFSRRLNILPKRWSRLFADLHM